MKLIRVTENASGAQFLAGDHKAKRYDTDPRYTVERNVVLTSQEISEYLDDEAENANYHYIVGVHAWLSELIAKEAGEQIALRIMQAIAERGGLHEFN